MATGSRQSIICRIAYAVSAWLFLCTGSVLIAGSANDLVSGRAALRSGDYENARKYFESALKDKTNPAASRAGLLQTLRMTGAYAEAVRLSEAFLRAQNDSALLYLECGRIADAVGDYSGAEKQLRQARALAPAGSALLMDATRDLAELLDSKGRKVDAGALWDQLIADYRQGRMRDSQSLGDAALAAWRRGYIRDAKDIFLDATDPKIGEISLETLTNFGFLFLDKYNAPDALSVFRDCLKINRFYPDALAGVALARKYDSDFEAEAYAALALKINPNFVPARNVMAELALESEDRDEALKRIRTALDVNPANLETLSLLAVCDYLRGDSSGFGETEKKILAINPSYGRLYYVLAENLVSQRKYQESLEFYRKAVALDPELWAAYTGLGMNLTRVGNLEEGRRAIQKAFDGDQYNVWAYNFLGLLDQMDTFAGNHSEHFAFLMSREDAPILSAYAPELAEEAYAKLTQRYGFKPDGPVQVEIFPDHPGFAVRTLGLPGLEGALGACFGKVLAIYSPRAQKMGTFNWGSTLWHEFTHVMTLQMSHYNIPRWYSEGLSVYEENRARPGWGDNLTSTFIKAYKEGKLLKVSELNSGIMRPQNPGQIVFSYLQASLVCQWMEQKFGFDRIRQSLLLFSENKSADEVFRRTLGLGTAEMDAEFARFLDSRIKELSSHLSFMPADSGRQQETAAGSGKENLERMLKANPDDFFANLHMGMLLRKEGANAEAEAYLKNAKRLFPQYVEPGNPYQILAELYLESKRSDDALSEYLAWSRLDGNAVEPLLKASEIYRGRKDLASTAQMLEMSVFINPFDQDIFKKLGEAAMAAEKWPQAIAAYRALIGLTPGDPAGAHFDLAHALFAAGKRQEAKREVLRALEIAPSFRKAQELLLKLSEEK
jgi:cellulose synthase operon protein C